MSLSSGALSGSITDATYLSKGIASFNYKDFIVSSGAVSIDYNNGQVAGGTLKGFLSSADWKTFNNKQNALAFGNLTASSNKISIGGAGAGAVIGPGVSVDVIEANITHNNLGGLATGDTHTQYLLLAGRVGGQTVTNSLGLVGSADTSQLKITANGTQTSPLIMAYRSDGTTEAFRIHSDHATTLFIGAGAGRANTAIGTDSEYQYDHSEGLFNSFIGTNAGYTNTTGNHNTALGWQAFLSNTVGSYNAAVGYDALRDNTEGTRNTAIGMEALLRNTTGSYNTAVGMDSNENNTSGSSNSALGFNALAGNTIGGSNSALGVRALANNIEGNYNTAVGTDSLRSNATGDNNVAVGLDALRTNTASSNTAVGTGSLRTNNTGSYNVGLGMYSLYSSTGSHNTGIGRYALYGADGAYNTAVGSGAGNGVVSSSTLYGNSLLGYQAGNVLITGANYNVLIGYKAGDAMTTGSRNIVIGYDIDAPAVDSTQILDIGNYIFATGLSGTGTTIPSGAKAGIGIAAPSAALHLKAGTASAFTAPLKFSSGPLLSTEEAGAFEFLTDTYYMTATNGVAGSTKRQAIPGVTTGTAAPTSTPVRVGDIYSDTTNKKIYMSTGTASSADWTILN